MVIQIGYQQLHIIAKILEQSLCWLVITCCLEVSQSPNFISLPQPPGYLGPCHHPASGNLKAELEQQPPGHSDNMKINTSSDCLVPCFMKVL